MLALLVVAAMAPQASPDAVRDAARSILSSSEFQRELPEASTGETSEVSAPPVSVPDLPAAPLSALSVVAQALMWVLIVVSAGLVLAFLVHQWRAPGRDPTDARTDGVTSSAVPDFATVPADAEALAAQGRHAEAIHVLLLATLDEMRRRLSLPMAPAMTSREVAGRVPLPGPAREALRSLVAAAERAWFAGVPAGSADWERCLATYRTFASLAVAPAG